MYWENTHTDTGPIGMDSLGIETRASRMLSGRDTTTPTAPEQKG